MRTMLGMDSGFYSDTGMMENDAAEDAAPEVLPAWKKISVNITERHRRLTAHVWEDLFAADMSWLCQRQLEYGKVETLDSPESRFQCGFNSVNQRYLKPLV